MLNESQLNALLGASETRLIERKASKPNDREIRKTLVAFANSVSEGEHAVMFIGITDDGRKEGVRNADDIQRDIRRIAENDCYPPVHCEPQAFRVSGVEIVAIVVPPSTNRPHFTGHAYVRRGSESVKASAEMFEEMIASRNDKARQILASEHSCGSSGLTANQLLYGNLNSVGWKPSCESWRGPITVPVCSRRWGALQRGQPGRRDARQNRSVLLATINQLLQAGSAPRSR